MERPRGPLDGQDPVARAVQDQGRHVDARDVGPEVGVPGRRRGLGREEPTARGDVPAVADRLLADPGPEVLIEVVEVQRVADLIHEAVRATARRPASAAGRRTVRDRTDAGCHGPWQARRSLLTRPHRDGAFELW